MDIHLVVLVMFKLLIYYLEENKKNLISLKAVVFNKVNKYNIRIPKQIEDDLCLDPGIYLKMHVILGI